MNELEARTIIENSGNYVEEEIEDVMDVYKEVVKHIGFEDRRNDSRFIVKFHDIIYYTEDIDSDEFESLFDAFCRDQYEYVMDELKENNIDIDKLLTKYDVGHYRAFDINVSEITEENAAEIAMDFYNEYGYPEYVNEYVNDYVKAIEILQNLEDNYMYEWLEFLEINDYPKEKLDEIRKNYEEALERRNATKTLAK